MNISILVEKLQYEKICLHADNFTHVHKHKCLCEAMMVMVMVKVKEPEVGKSVKTNRRRSVRQHDDINHAEDED